MVCNAGLVSGIKQETIVDVFSEYCIQQVVMVPGKSYSFVELMNDEFTSQAINKINGKLILPEVRGPLYLLPVEKSKMIFLNSYFLSCLKNLIYSSCYQFHRTRLSILSVNLTDYW